MWCTGAPGYTVAMIERTATCRCGQLQARCTGEPVRISVCHCLSCQKRSGSSFAAQARWPDAQVEITGDYREWAASGDSGGVGIFRFCPTCGATLTYTIEALPGLTAVAIGGFADPDFPAPQYSVYEVRKHRWVEIVGDAIDRWE
ncbi:MAG: hypothetical protein RL490_2374 [Pseudomonadota bacterium]